MKPFHSGLVAAICVLGCAQSAVQSSQDRLVPVVAPGTVTQHSFRFNDTTYAYWVFVPATWTLQQRLPAMLLLHGAGGEGLGMLMAWRSFADRNGIILVAPTFPMDAKFEATIPRLFPALMDTVRRALDFDPRRVYVFGYSAGGYCTFDAAILSSHYFAAAGIFASIISPDYESIVETVGRKTPIAMYIGDHDRWFGFTQTRRTRDILSAHGFPVHYVEIANQDHNFFTISDSVEVDVWAFMRHFSL